MLKIVDPVRIAPPPSRCSHAVDAPTALRWVHVSGQAGVLPGGTLAPGIDAQVERAWLNLFAVLAAAGLSPRHLVKVTAFLTRAEDVAAYRRVSDRMLEGAAPASTLLLVAGFADPGHLVEIEGVAAG